MDISKIKTDEKIIPASLEEINLVEKKLDLTLPQLYCELLELANGFTNIEGVNIYGTEEIIERNETWEVKEYAHGYVAIGDDGGGNVFLMKAKLDEQIVIAVDSGYMQPDSDSEIISSNLYEWISSGCQIQKNIEYDDLCDIILVGIPKNGKEGLVEIKKQFNLEMSIIELYKSMKKLPVTLVKNIPNVEAEKILNELNEFAKCLMISSI